MKIYLVRHGQSLANIDHKVYTEIADHAVPLSPLGIQQAEKAAEFLSAELSVCSKIRIWSSPYKRARQTAKIILKELEDEFNVDYKEHISLVEQQFGLFDGIPEEDLDKAFPEERKYANLLANHNGNFWCRRPMGESSFDVAVRVHAAFGTFIRDFEREGIDTIVVVSHAATMRAFTMQWLNLPWEWFEDEPKAGNCNIRLIQDNEDQGFVYKGITNEN